MKRTIGRSRKYALGLSAFALCFFVLSELWAAVPPSSAAAERPAEAVSAPQAQAPNAAPVGFRFDKDQYNFGEIEEGQTVKTVFLGTNGSDRPIKINRAKASCGCTVAKVSKNLVPPGETVEIAVEFNTVGKRGSARKRVWLETDFEPKPTFDLWISGTVLRTATGHPIKEPGKNIFSESCNTCHTMKGYGKLGTELFKADCAMCHGNVREGTMIAPALNWTYGFAKREEVLIAIIATGSTNPMMPGFSKRKGGPLTEEQIISLVTWLKTEAEREEQLVAEGKRPANPGIQSPEPVKPTPVRPEKPEPARG